MLNSDPALALALVVLFLIGLCPPAPAAETFPELKLGETLLQPDLQAGPPSGWEYVAGNGWSYVDARFGDLSDSDGPTGDGNWAAAGDPGWTDVRLSADVVQAYDGMGYVYLAVRFQDPRNYYALEWSVEDTDVLRLIRCRNAYRYLLAEARGQKIRDFPHNLAVAVAGDLLVGYVDNRPVVSAYAADFARGRIALGERQRAVLMDQIKVERVTGGGGSARLLRDLQFGYGLKPRYFLRSAGRLTLPIFLRNAGSEPVRGVQMTVSLHEPRGTSALQGDVAPIKSSPALLPTLTTTTDMLRPAQAASAGFVLDTRKLRAGVYLLYASCTAAGLSREEVIPIGIARDWNPERFNYFTWGLPSNEAEIRDYVEHGHTAGIGNGRSTPRDWAAKGGPVPPGAGPLQLNPSGSGSFDILDLCLKYGMLGGTNLQTDNGRFPADQYGQDVNGKPTTLPVPYAQPFHDYSVNLARRYAQDYSDYPAYRLMHLNTETEWQNNIDYSPRGLERARAEFGDVPPKEARNLDGVPADRVPGLAQNGVIDDNHPLLRFYRWYYLRGEGWNVLDREMGEAVRQVAPQILTIHDPAERNPFMRDRNDGLNPWDWTYTTPNALCLAYKIEELLAMSKPPHQAVTNYTQVLWKATTVSPYDECPSAAIIRLGLLFSTSRPVWAAGHWNTEWMRAPENRDRWQAVKELSDNFWRPLGPVLTNLDNGPRREVAFLVSHTNELFGPKLRGMWTKFYAYAAWYEAFQRASVPADIMYEESVSEGKLAGYKYLFIPLGEVISRSAYDQIVKFAQRGGVVIADKNLGYSVPGAHILKADMNHMIWPNWGYNAVKSGKGPNAEECVRRMWAATDEVSALIAPARAKLPLAEDKWLVINPRSAEGLTYVFAVNDKRSAGDQVGQYGVELEQGEPLTAAITAPAAGVAAVYDLEAHCRVATTRVGDRLRWVADYRPASAKVFALLPQAIADLQVRVTPVVRKGEAFDLALRLLDPAGKPVRGVLPLRVTIRDGQGALSEYSDYFAARNGAWRKQGFVALNDRSGKWSAQVDDLASGLSRTVYFEVPV